MENLKYSDKINTLKEKILQMLYHRSENIEQTESKSPDRVWAETLSIFDYIINLTPENFIKIRLHTSAITGEFVYHYWHKYPFINPESFANEIGYKSITEDIPKSYWIGEPSLSNSDIPLGINYKNRIINKNIARYQSCISNLYYMGILNKILKEKERKAILEIGGGYGGLAHHLGEILNNKATYILLDFPEMLLFSGSYLIVNNPEKKIYIYDKNTFTSEFIRKETLKYDFILIPNFGLNDLRALKDLYLIINMQSFQEMTELQINDYAEFGREKLSGYIYSNNIDRHPINKELGLLTVTEILGRHYDLFPNPKIYNKPSLYSDHPWYYKFYFGVPKGKEEDYSENAFIKIREYVPDNSISSVGYHPIKWRKIYFQSKKKH